MTKRAAVGMCCVIALAAGCSPLDAQCPCRAGWICDESGGKTGVCVQARQPDGPLDAGPRLEVHPLVEKAPPDRGPCTPQWEPMVSGTNNPLAAIWGTSATDIFAVGGSGTILRFNGSTWTPMTSPTTRYLTGVWGTSASDVFAVGGDFKASTALRFDGGSWKEISPATQIDLSAVWGTSSTDVFASAGAFGTGGSGGMIFHYDGASWSPMLTSIDQQVMSVWGFGPHDVFAVGRNVGATPGGAHIWHYDGTKWAGFAMNTVLNLWTVRALEPGAVLAAGDTVVRCTPSLCAPYQGAPKASLRGLWVAAPDCVYVTGENGLIIRYDGKSWTQMQSGTKSYLTSVWASDCEHAFAVGGPAFTMNEGTIVRLTCK